MGRRAKWERGVDLGGRGEGAMADGEDGIMAEAYAWAAKKYP